MASRVLLAHPPFDEGLGRDFNVSDFRVVGSAYSFHGLANFRSCFVGLPVEGFKDSREGAVNNKAQGYDAEGLAFCASGYGYKFTGEGLQFAFVQKCASLSFQRWFLQTYKAASFGREPNCRIIMPEKRNSERPRLWSLKEYSMVQGNIPKPLQHHLKP